MIFKYWNEARCVPYNNTCTNKFKKLEKVWEILNICILTLISKHF